MLLAFDFDLTTIDIHTHGAWSVNNENDVDSIHELLQHVRPEITCIIYECMKRNLSQKLHHDNNDNPNNPHSNYILHVAVTTFSQQTQLITSVMTELLNDKILPYLQQEDQEVEEVSDSGGTTTTALSIPVYGGRNEEEPTGKEKQLQQAIDDINNNNINSNMNNDNDETVVKQQHQNHHSHQHVQHSQHSQQKHVHHSSVVVTKQNTILIDDNYNNIRIAKKDGYKAIWFDPKNPNPMNHVTTSGNTAGEEEVEDNFDFFQSIIHYDNNN